MKFSILASGSEGNAALLCAGSTRILIDNGLSMKTLLQRMKDVGEEWGDGLDGVILSHAHTDHASGLPVLLRHSTRRGSPTPVYVTPMTATRLKLGEHPPFRFFEGAQKFPIGNIEVEAFSVLHDCCDPVNWVFTADGIQVGFSTDLGFVPPAMKRKFADCRVIVLESNHDVEMLHASSYPDQVKERVAGRSGHLSNDQAAEFLSKGCNAEIVVLSHLSKECNRPDLAEWSARKALVGNNTKVLVAKQDEAMVVFEAAVERLGEELTTEILLGNPTI